MLEYLDQLTFASVKSLLCQPAYQAAAMKVPFPKVPLPIPAPPETIGVGDGEGTVSRAMSVQCGADQTRRENSKKERAKKNMMFW